MAHTTQTAVGAVVSLWRYPVKSLMGEELNATEVTERGLLGDRAYALVDRVMADPRLNANPAVDEAHHKVPPAGFKYLAAEMVCWATGGPQTYTGRSMADSHRHLNITPQEWEAFYGGLAADARQVPGAGGRAGRSAGDSPEHLWRHRGGQGITHSALTPSWLGWT